MNLRHSSLALDDSGAFVATGWRLRRVLPRDADSLDRLIRRQSPQSRRWRFHAAVKSLSPGLMKSFVRPDGMRSHGLVVEGPRGVLLADGRLALCPSRRVAEFGLLVDESWQRQGIGRQLLAVLAQIARRHGARELAADVLADNVGMLLLAQQFGFRRVAPSEHGDTWRLCLPVASTIGSIGSGGSLTAPRRAMAE